MKIKECLKNAIVKFEASMCPQENNCGGGSLRVLEDRLKPNVEIDRVNFTYELMYPTAREKTSDGRDHLDDDLDSKSKYLKNKHLEIFSAQLKAPFVKAGVDFEYRRKPVEIKPLLSLLFISDFFLLTEDNLITTIRFSIDIEEAAKLASAMESLGYEEIPGNKRIVNDIKSALEQIAEYKKRCENEEIIKSISPFLS